jgi:3-deoxy-7-phosphoheptulonate synthase
VDVSRPKVSMTDNGGTSPGLAAAEPGRPGTDREESPWWPGNWRSLPSAQQPEWAGAELTRARRLLSVLPGLVAPLDLRALRRDLAECQAGRAFVLQGGDCAEPLGPAAVAGARAKTRLLGRMATVISGGTGLPVITVGRLAGQFAKPRSQPTEQFDGRRLPVFRGLVVNSPEATEAARRPRPDRLVEAYVTARDVVDELLRLAGRSPSAAGGRPVNDWLAAPRWCAPPPALSTAVHPYGRTSWTAAGWSHNGLWTSHEALILDYEQALTRRDPETGEWYLASAHQPWLGYRTSQPGGGHVAFLRGLANPLAVKVGPETDPVALVGLCRLLDPAGTPGRLTLVARLGARLVRERLPRLVEAVRRAGRPVAWMCDPMHGNTVITATGLKTRHYADVDAELTGFFEVMARLRQWPGGVHLELAADDVTECVGGGGPALADVPTAYRTLCDPRLNDVQAIALAQRAAELLRALGSGRAAALSAAAS